MNRKILFTVVFCLSSFYHTFSQTTFSLPFGDYYLFTHQDKYYILDTKKLYETTDGVNWSEREHHLDFTKVELGHLNLDSNTTYLFYRSGGNAYTFDGKQFKAIYSKGEFRNQHHSFPFLYKQMPHLFGGYGLFTLKNIITYLVPETSNWEYIPYYGEEENQPKPRSKPMAQQDGDELYIGLGFNLNTLSTKSDEHNYLKDFWKFNFKTRVWKKLGTSNLVTTNGKMDNEASFFV